MKRLLIALPGALVLISLGTILISYVGQPRNAVPSETSDQPPAAFEHPQSLLLGATSTAFAGTSTPALAWSPSQVTITLVPGESPNFQATVTAQNDVKGTSIWLAPSLARFVRASPPTTPALRKGATQRITLSFASPADAPFQIVTGTLHLRVGTATIAKPLPVTINIGRSATAPGGLTFAYPADWILRTDDNRTTITKPGDHSVFDPDAGLENVFFRMQIMEPRRGSTSQTHANPDMLPIEQWFEHYFSEGFHVRPETNLITIAGRTAVRMELPEATGPSAHIYLPNGLDILEISFRLGSPFTAEYETILKTLTP